MSLSYGSLYSGGGGADLGALAAGLTPVFGVEMDPADEKSERFSRAAADCYEANIGAHVIRVPVEDVDPHSLPPVDCLHASPVCTRFSVANKARGEKDADRTSAAAVCRFLRVMKPRVFTLENVEGYAKSEAFALIVSCLEGMGYFVDYAVLNSANFLVPQTRRRLILRAVYGALVPCLPPPTRWCSWYEAIEDLIPTLPESRFAPWQLARLPSELAESFFIPNDNTGSVRGKGDSLSLEPANTITSEISARAFLMGNQKGEWGEGVRNALSPAYTIKAGCLNRYRAFLVDGKPSNFDGDLMIREEGNPCPPLTATQDKHPFRAFIMDGRNTRTTTDEPFTLRADDEPCFTVCAADGSERNRAFVAGMAQGQPALFSDEHSPAWLSQGRVVSMSPRALGRFQSFPDWYVFPAKPAVATRLIGNAAPPLLLQKVYEGLTK